LHSALALAQQKSKSKSEVTHYLITKSSNKQLTVYSTSFTTHNVKNVKSFPSQKVVLISISLALSQTPVHTARCLAAPRIVGQCIMQSAWYSLHLPTEG